MSIIRIKPNYQYKTFSIKMNQSNIQMIHRIKSFYEQRVLQYGYSGFSYKIDSFFDQSSTFFYVSDHKNNLKSTLRCTLRKQENRLPFEYAIRPGGSHYICKESSQIAELNTFTFTDFNSVPLLWASLINYVKEQQIKKIFCLVDPENEFTQRFYGEIGFSYSHQYNENVYFPTYGKIEEGSLQPTKWRILEITYDQMVNEPSNFTKH